ncbi:glycine-rich RNA-binding protein 10-like [Helianthus annuus]|uniref:glycine-rich RNA-binding protein 10-like n=1 Tax=Helianthus annuus TaxID=4232 RepID=UPI000B905E8E|nr:glycine-rich RNA-binding protein 10-like [Helianthus annuus]
MKVVPIAQDKWVSLHSSFGLICWCDDEKLADEFEELNGGATGVWEERWWLRRSGAGEVVAAAVWGRGGGDCGEMGCGRRGSGGGGVGGEVMAAGKKRVVEERCGGGGWEKSLGF